MDSNNSIYSNIDIENLNKCDLKIVDNSQPEDSGSDMDISDDDNCTAPSIIPEKDFFFSDTLFIDTLINNDKENCLKDYGGRRRTLSLRSLLKKLPPDESKDCDLNSEAEVFRDERDLEMSFLNNEIKACKDTLKDEQSLLEKLLQLCEKNSDIFSDEDQFFLKNYDLKPFEVLIEKFRNTKNLLEAVNKNTVVEEHINNI
uniref:EB1 C-terminal domain-containing protein n=1 Tax=Strongyloides stercoralis TaxID=6248 RepID=A0A0K0E5R2_STRER